VRQCFHEQGVCFHEQGVFALGALLWQLSQACSRDKRAPVSGSKEARRQQEPCLV
jgi:hypothetical protein